MRVCRRCGLPKEDKEFKTLKGYNCITCIRKKCSDDSLKYYYRNAKKMHKYLTERRRNNPEAKQKHKEYVKKTRIGKAEMYKNYKKKDYEKHKEERRAQHKIRYSSNISYRNAAKERATRKENKEKRITRQRKGRIELNDEYVRRLILESFRKRGIAMKTSDNIISDKMIETRRLIISLKRGIKNQKQKQHGKIKS